MIAMTRAMPELLEAGRYPFVYRVHTRFADLDPNGHINNVALAIAFEDARVRFDQEAGSRVHARDLGILAAANYMDYVGEAYYPDPIDVHVATWEIGRSSWTLASLAVQNDVPCAFSRAVLVAMSDGRPAPLPPAFRTGLGRMALEQPHVSG